MKHAFVRFGMPAVFALVASLGLAADERQPWTVSRLKGSPEPPPPYRLERAYPKLSFINPVLLTRGPDNRRWFVATQESKIFSFVDRDDVDHADLMMDLHQAIQNFDKNIFEKISEPYGLAFHPKFSENRYVYICYVFRPRKGFEDHPGGSRVSRIKVVGDDPPVCDPASEEIIFSWRAGGHNGGHLRFGPDGYLYITTGDSTGPNPPDELNTGQDCSDFSSSILRIDVDRPSGDKLYSVPNDNPFINVAGVRPEIWAFGFRNPWALTFDRKTGQMWVGDVGWELWELIHRVQRGGNYGWSVKEGPQWIKPEGKVGPTPILPPTIAFPHSEAASITGGFVYHGSKLPDLLGEYICGDWATGRLWATRTDQDRIIRHREIVRAPVRVVAFGEDESGELLVVHHHSEGTLHRIVPNEAIASARPEDFPRKLSETGLFENVQAELPAAGVYPFEVNVAQWSDFAQSKRWVAIPGKGSIDMLQHPAPFFGVGKSIFNSHVLVPEGTVFVKTLSMELVAGNPSTRKRLETQVLHYEDQEWRAYSYKWNDAGTDAELVSASGDQLKFDVQDPQSPGEIRRHQWRIHSRAECFVCHNSWSSTALAFNPQQLQQQHPEKVGKSASSIPAPESQSEQWQRFQELGLIVSRERNLSDKPGVFPAFANWNSAASADDKIRSYLHVNCSHCHQFNAGGTVDIDLRTVTPLEKTKLVGMRPVQGTFQLTDAQIIAPGKPAQSVLLYRMSKIGRGRMPHLGSEFVDHHATTQIRNWIAAMSNDSPPTIAWPDPAPAESERLAWCVELLQVADRAHEAAYQYRENLVPAAWRGPLMQSARTHPAAAVRDLFEQFVPHQERIERLGGNVTIESLAELTGSVEEGRRLFAQKEVTNCANCHRAQEIGGQIGPDLSDVATRLSQREILESLLDPSKKIDPKFVAYSAELKDGRVVSGLVQSQSDAEIVLRNSKGEDIRISRSEIEELTPQAKSLMPDQLLRDLTRAQAGHLIAYLKSLKAPANPAGGK